MEPRHRYREDFLPTSSRANKVSHFFSDQLSLSIDCIRECNRSIVKHHQSNPNLLDFFLAPRTLNLGVSVHLSP